MFHYFIHEIKKDYPINSNFIRIDSFVNSRFSNTGIIERWIKLWPEFDDSYIQNYWYIFHRVLFVIRYANHSNLPKSILNKEFIQTFL